MKKIKTLLSLSLILTLFFACKKDNDTPSGGAHKVIYKAVGSAGTNINIAVTATGVSGGTETFTSLTGSTWTSPEYTFPANAVVATAAVSGTGPSATSTLKVQIFVDGVMKAEGNSTGTILSAQGTYSF
ncbi:hypothetical protein [Pedobacter jejuensis]|uniref:BACON domain-containing protein n=1 Tax=Pedobacter jejuensis TaxID=1268550 RepID=A0A3N0BLM2_9SPHI|nr:hypothetical protein [Pedobacter jejuensis]RNL49595.1 hypothetical protein D7004_19470 [Pedobacter jejuensis]